MPRITISYRRTDTGPITGRIRDRLAVEYGEDAVFMDIDDIPFGKDFRSHISEVVSQSDILLVIIGRRWLGATRNRPSRIKEETDLVRLEVHTALKSGVRIIPVVIDAAPMPKPEQLPEGLEKFAFLNAAPVDTGRDFRQHMNRLIRSLDSTLQSINPPTSPAAVTSDPAKAPPAAKGIDEFPFDWIAMDLRKGNCIPFLGAGASAFPRDISAKPPSARALALELAKETMYPPYQVALSSAGSNDVTSQERIFRAKFDCENLMLVSSWVDHGLGDRSRLHDKLREYLANEQKPLPCNSLHDLLARTAQQNPMAIMTTNYDDLAELALVERAVPFDLFVVAIDRPAAEARGQGGLLFRPAGQDELTPVTGEQALLDLDLDGGRVRLKRTALFKICGHIDRRRGSDDTFIITEEDHVSPLGRMGSGDSLIPADLMTLMQSRTLLFLGYGLRDWNFRVLADRLNRMQRRAKRSYAIAQNIDPVESQSWDQRNVAVFDADLNEFVSRLDAVLAQGPSSST